jgi:hypothetical protein
MDLDLSESGVWDMFESVSFQDRLGIKFEDRSKCHGFVLDCTEAGLVMVRLTTDIVIIHPHLLE